MLITHCNITLLMAHPEFIDISSKSPSSTTTTYPSSTRPLIAQALIHSMETSLTYCLNKILVHPHAKPSAISFAKAMLDMVQRESLDQSSSLRTTLETAIALHDTEA